MSSKGKTLRPCAPKLDAVLGKKFPVLDDGFIRPIDYLGDDSAVVQAARVSYGAGTKTIHEDRGLIRYLMRHHHTTPFEMCEIKFHVRVPMDTWRQWIRHRTANVNEYSTRYSIAIDSAQKTLPGEWRLQAGSNRQGSSGTTDLQRGKKLTLEEAGFQNRARALYQRRIDLGVAREQARKDLPLSTYTEAYWKIDLHNLLHFLRLRMDSHAQHEIRQYAEVIGNQIVSRWVPNVWEAFADYALNAIVLSARDASILKLYLKDRSVALEKAASFGWLKRDAKDGALRKNREREEFVAKVRDGLGLQVNWERQAD